MNEQYDELRKNLDDMSLSVSCVSALIAAAQTAIEQKQDIFELKKSADLLLYIADDIQNKISDNLERVYHDIIRLEMANS